jgi:2-alkyl-3-oxoalkanoate reductase
MMATEARGASNAKAKRELGWTPRYPSWRQGFAEAYADPSATSVTRFGRARAAE